MSDLHVHQYVELPMTSRVCGYHKRGPDGQLDTTRSYTVLYCTQCEDRLEIVALDINPLIESKEHLH